MGKGGGIARRGAGRNGRGGGGEEEGEGEVDREGREEEREGTDREEVGGCCDGVGSRENDLVVEHITSKLIFPDLSPATAVLFQSAQETLPSSSTRYALQHQVH